MMMKRSWLKFAFLLSFAALALPQASLRAQENAPKKIDVSKFKTGVDNVVIPVPSEVFNALDKLGGNPNWAGVLKGGESAKKPSSRPEIAMLLGVVIADGFIAVEAKDSAKVNDIGRRVIELANALSVKDAVLSHCNSIIDASKRDDWASVRSELDKTQHDVGTAMEKLHDKEIAELISIAGWLRGTDALSSLVRQDYKPDRADLLHQPDMLETFDKQFGTMSVRLQGNEMVHSLRLGLKKIRPLIENHDGDPIPQKSVEQINDISSELVKTIAP